MKKKNKGKQKSRKRVEMRLRDALDSNQRIVQYGKNATDALDMRAILTAASPDAAIRERAQGLLYGAALLLWHYSPAGEASEQYATMCEQAFTMAGNTLASYAPAESDEGDD